MMNNNLGSNKLKLASSAKIVCILLIGGVYFTTAKIGLFFAIVHTNITALWAPSGIALAAFFLLGRWIWPGILVGALFTNLSIGTPILFATGIGIGNMLGPLLGAAILHRFRDFHSDFSRVKDVLVFGLIAATTAPFFSASIGVLSLWMGGADSTFRNPCCMVGLVVRRCCWHSYRSSIYINPTISQMADSNCSPGI